MQPDVRVQVTQLMALAFLPVAIVRLTFATLEQQANDILRPLFQYFRQEWLTAKTTPAVEYAQTTTARGMKHVRFSNALGKHHPNIWKFLEYLLEEQASLEVMHQQIRGGR